jgi:hypothetical protein
MKGMQRNLVVQLWSNHGRVRPNLTKWESATAVI